MLVATNIIRLWNIGINSESRYIVAEEEISHMPVFWEVGYMDETGQERWIIDVGREEYATPEPENDERY